MNKNTIKPDMTVEASNKLIAEFMGATYHPKISWWVFTKAWSNVFVFPWNKSIGFMPKGLKYHISWDWLMPVIEKISQLNLPDPDGSSEDWQPFPRTFGMTNDDTGDFMFRFNRYSIHEATKLIDAAYLAVVEFLELEAEEKGGSSE